MIYRKIAFGLVLTFLIISIAIGINKAQADREVEIYRSNLKKLENVTKKFDELFPIEQSRFKKVSYIDLQDQDVDYRRAVEDMTNRIPLFKGEGNSNMFGSSQYMDIKRSVLAEILLRLEKMGELNNYDLDLGNMEKDLSDVPAGSWYEDAVYIAVKNGVFVPKDGKVRPYGPLNWAELATILRRYLNLENPDEDLDSKDWYESEIQTLADIGIGVNEKLRPGQYPTKMHLVRILYDTIGRGSIVGSYNDDKFGQFDCSMVYRNQDYCYARQAELKNNEKICRRIASSFTRNNCYIERRIANGVDPECMSYDDTVQLSCLCDQYKATFDDSIWENVPNKYRKENCHIGETNGYEVAIVGYNKTTNDASKCTKIEDENTQVDCILRQLGRDKKWSICEQATSEYAQDSCYLKIVQDNNVSELCHKVRFPERRDDCFSIVAANLMDEVHCQSISNPLKKKNCQVAVALYQQESLMCENSDDADTKILCYEYCREKDDLCYLTSFCDQFEDSELRGYCITRIATDYHNMDLCEEIENLSARDHCYRSFAAMNEDYKICIAIKDQEDRNTCLLDMAKREDNTEICLEIDSEIAKDDCIKSISYEQRARKIEGCKDGDVYNAWCLRELSYSEDDLSYCRLINENDSSADLYKPICLQDFAIKYKDPDLCDEIEKASEEGQFYSREGCELAVKMKDKEMILCETEDDPDLCYLAYGMANDDFKACSKIKEFKVNQYCLKELLFK